MPLFKHLRSLNWVGLGVELVLIFIGITAALWFDGLKEAREAQRTEQQILVELSRSLAQDTADLNMNLRVSARTRASIDTILTYFDNGRPYAAELANHFATASIFTAFIQNPGVYEYLKSIGVGAISDDDLRVSVSRYYEYTVPYLRGVEDLVIFGNWNDAMKPQMMEKFAYRFLFEPAEPHDYELLRGDREYRTVLTSTREMIQWKDTRTRDVLVAAEELLAELKVRQ
jgi:hypothetical protein